MKKLSIKTQKTIVVVVTLVLGTLTLMFSGYKPVHTHRVLSQPINQQVIVDLAQTVDLEKIWSEVNQQREINGLSPLVRDAMLDKAAQAKCNDMVAKDYWSHNAPDGTTPWFFIGEQGISYRTAGENLAYGFGNSDSVASGWMKSPGHRANIVDARFTNVGYAQCKYTDTSKQGRYTLIVQLFTLPM